MTCVIYINNRVIWLPKSAFFRVVDAVLPVLKTSLDDDSYHQIAGVCNGLNQLDLEDLDSQTLTQVNHAIQSAVDEHIELKNFADELI